MEFRKALNLNYFVELKLAQCRWSLTDTRFDRTMRVSLAVKERGAPAPLVREMSVLSGEDN